MADETGAISQDLDKPPVLLDSAFADAAPGQNIELPWIKMLQLDITSLETLTNLNLAPEEMQISEKYNMVASGNTLDTRAPDPVTFDAKPDHALSAMQLG